MGHAFAGALLFGLPVYLILIGLHIGDGGSVTPEKFLKGLAGATVAGFLFGAVFWFTATKWLKKATKDKR